MLSSQHKYLQVMDDSVNNGDRHIVSGDPECASNVFNRGTIAVVVHGFYLVNHDPPFIYSSNLGELIVNRSVLKGGKNNGR